ncbi:monoamine oxidase n [Colletotrichum truncatum]|uniref:Monoamine oxidase n n=1 Tax=Colletotrichum truncatum TaxID=5467 RepID=A0ACC3Z3R3_COLTU|nr:monoamine oxidase n [Colletotrichum truncatum]XP_036585430.1 monoamine oxidase n [Colletotrichum truncatum]KAF6780685.1 monoamine oxidase n [Colletotrichum truncatum]KAF6795481.1 monoamine oxidase n [Colletotrichum truncatum]
MTSKTSDGYQWTSDSKTVQRGLETNAVIKPPRRGDFSLNRVYDAVVIGAGYAGLAAARDLVTKGHSVLLIEARDRVGGRTYTVTKDGFLYEMGGTWVTHHMGYLFREMVRYDMDRDLIETGSPDKDKGYYTINVPDAEPRKLSHEEAGKMSSRAWDVFVNVDGEHCRTLCPLPHAQLNNIVVDRATIEKWDKMSCQDRFEQIKHKLSPEERGLLVSLLLHISGGEMETSSLWDMIRSHALMAHDSKNFGDIWLRYKLKEGQTALARNIFHEAVDHGLDYSFSTPVAAIAQKANQVHIQSQSGEVFRAQKVVCTIPLNVLQDIHFSPPLSQKRQDAIQLGHVNQMSKIHADVGNPELERWNGMRFPGVLMYGYGDGVLPNGDVHVVGFGKDERTTFVPEKNPELAVDAFQKLHPMDVRRVIFHNWCTDPYSKGGPAWWRPGYMSKYQDELQSRWGNVFFASGDWAHGWRASIDGALEQGTVNAQQITKELKKLDKRARNLLQSNL